MLNEYLWNGIHLLSEAPACMLCYTCMDCFQLKAVLTQGTPWSSEQQTLTVSSTHHAPSSSSCTCRSWEPLEGETTKIYCLEEVPVLVPAACTSFSSVQFSHVTQSCPILCNPMDCSMPGFPVHHQLLELTQTHVH